MAVCQTVGIPVASSLFSRLASLVVFGEGRSVPSDLYIGNGNAVCYRSCNTDPAKRPRTWRMHKVPVASSLFQAGFVPDGHRVAETIGVSRVRIIDHQFLRNAASNIAVNWTRSTPSLKDR